MKRIIVISSGKGGVGKTTTAINLGAAINHFGGDVLIIDGNLSTPNVGVYLNSPEVPVSLNHVLRKKYQAYEAVYEHESGMKIMPSSLSIKELKKIRPEKLKHFKDDFKQISDYIILDSAAGLGNEASSAMELADDLIIVTNPDIIAITDALKTIKLAEQKNKKVLGVIVTRVKKHKTELQPSNVKDLLEVPILGMIPEDISIVKALNQKNPVVHVYPKSNSARAYKEIAAKILDVPYNSNQDKEIFFMKWFKKYY
jgi:septum site-determining protein MinD